ncbi:S8 family serine peptidase [Spirulina sp. CS-785/01]|uniref:S8 family serine peptidase n=1 Tax=Spirulina sp. CS-785/01 TaxID=3021716 RepID=UPI00232CE777|nr:S8 family serine peptidase [Spirulina sp. CS-785/01]MDB9312223.1 S8 family serine peptidase [Spirulina sp. CS-785/01]
MFNFRKRASKAKPEPQNQIQSFILEPILTPSGLIDVDDGGGPDAPDIPTDLDPPTLDDQPNSPAEESGAVSILSDPQIEIDPPDFSADLFQADAGEFTVGISGEVGIDFLFDGGKFQGEVGIFSLEGMDEFEAGSEEFIQEAAIRAASDSELGHIVISDKTEGAKFEGSLGESKNWNSGDYQGVKTVSMRPGDKFAVMLVPDGTVDQVIENPAIDGSKAPLFSLGTTNPDDTLHFGQIADVTGDGNTFVMEDVQAGHNWYDQDYNDLIFQVRGAEGEAPLMEDLIKGEDWREGDLGQALVNYAEQYVDETASEKTIPDVESSQQPLVGVIDTGFNGENPDLDYDKITLGKDRVDGDDNPLLSDGEGNEHGTHVLGVIAAEQDNGIGTDGINDDAPLWVGRAVGSGQWAESLVEFVDAARESEQPNAVVNLSMDLTQIDAEGNVTTRYEFTPMEMAALEYARQNNVVVSVAAGNDGAVMSALGQASERFDNIITVGAAEQINGETSAWKGFDRADYSSYGNGLDIVANGGILEDPIMSTVGDGVEAMQGTSVATAQVTGAASQVWAANPELSYRQVIDILKSTATDLKDANPDVETGTGLLNMAAAIHLAKATQPEEYEPELQVVPTTWSGEGKVTPMERAVRYSYKLKDGETLWTIAERELGDGSRWTEITKDAAGTTPFTSVEAKFLPVGQVIYIPGDAPNAQSEPTLQPDPNQVKQVAQSKFLNAFKTSLSPLWMNFLKQMFEKFYKNPNDTLDSQASQQGTGTASTVTPQTNPTQSTKTGPNISLDITATPIEETPTDSGVVNSKVGSLPLNFRKSSYVGATVLNSLPKGTSFTILNSVTGGTYTTPSGASRNDWYQIKVNGQTGYVAGYYVDVTSSPDTGTSTTPGYVNSNVGGVRLNFRSNPKVGASILGKLSKGSDLTILDKVSGGAYYPGNRTDWYKVKVDGEIGYVAAYYVSESNLTISTGNNSSNLNPILTTQSVQYFKDRPQFYGVSGNYFAATGFGSTLLGTNNYGKQGNCTWYAYGRLKELGFNPKDILLPPGDRDASQWGQVLKNGARILNSGELPRIGDVAQYYLNGQNHVAIVEKVENGRVHLSESNWYGAIHGVENYSIGNPHRYIRLKR